MTEALILLAAVQALLLAAALFAFFRLRSRHRCCRHALNSARRERDRLKLRVVALERGTPLELVGG